MRRTDRSGWEVGVCENPGSASLAVTTRTATDADHEFLFELHRLALGPYVEATWGWDEDFQAKMFRDEWRPDAMGVLLAEEEPIGSLIVEDHEDHVLLEYIAIIPEYQGRGIGTSLIREVVGAAAGRGLPVRLHVLKVNPARALYERLGFHVIGGDEKRWLMEAKVLDVADGQVGGVTGPGVSRR